MRVIVNDHVYEMTREQCDGVLKTGSKQVPSGIYAVEKDGMVELKNERFQSKKLLNREVVVHEKAGFKVYWNE